MEQTCYRYTCFVQPRWRFCTWSSYPHVTIKCHKMRARARNIFLITRKISKKIYACTFLANNFQTWCRSSFSGEGGESMTKIMCCITHTCNVSIVTSHLLYCNQVWYPKNALLTQLLYNITILTPVQTDIGSLLSGTINLLI